MNLPPRRHLVPLFATVLALLASACTEDETNRVRLYRASAFAPSLTEEGLVALEHLGPVIVDQGVNFALYSANAEKVDLLLFDDPEAERPTRQFPMVRLGDVWSIHIEGIGEGQHYGYIAWGPNWPYADTWRPGKIDGFIADVDRQGNRFNPNKLLIDPYAKLVHRDHDWARASVATGPARTQSSWGAGAKSIVATSAYQWSANEAAWQARRKDPNAPGNGWNEHIIYEVHLKGMTADPASGVANPGTFRGVGQKAAYLAELGITAVELMPVFEKPMDGGYWGYHSLSFFAPEVSYLASHGSPDPSDMLDEVKWMVDELHKHGIEVWLDVVYNHTGEGGVWREKFEQDDVDFDPITSADLANFEPKEVASIYSWRGIDNAAYYILDDEGQYWHATGVGNQLRCNHRPVRKLILDSLHYWTQEMHIDGFRFDLAPALGVNDADYENWDSVENTVLQDIVDDPILLANNVRVIAEPWAAGGNYRYQIGAFPSSTATPQAGFAKVGWYEWNGRFRDWWRAFMNFDEWKLNSQEGDADGGFLLTGCDRYYGQNGRGPYHSVNFISVHDGMTMYDVFTYGEKRNGCGPLNPTCCEDPLSVWCDLGSGEDNNRSRDWGEDDAGEAMKRQLMRNLFVALMIAHGTPMIYAGDEWMRTQLGNNNAYSTRSDTGANWLQWGHWQNEDERQRMFDFVKQVIELRKRFIGKLSPKQYGQGAAFAWKSAQNTEPPDWSSRHLMIHYSDETGGPQLLVLMNLERRDVSFTLPGGRSWRRLVDTQRYFESEDWFGESGAPRRVTSNATLEGGVVVTGEYTVKDSSIVILAAED